MIVEHPATAAKIERLRLKGKCRELIKCHRDAERLEAQTAQRQAERDDQVVALLGDLTKADISRVLGISQTTVGKIPERVQRRTKGNEQP